MKKIALITSLVLLTAALAYSQARFYARSDAREVLTNSYFEVEFILENGRGSNFSPPDFGKLKVVSGPNQSSQISIVNGRRTEKKGYRYTLIASDAGNYTIGPASIRVNGKNMRSESLSIKVLKGRERKASNTQEDVFVRAEISDTIAYPGQQLLLRYVLYTNKRIKGYNFLSQPAFEGFFTQEINTVNRSQRQVINGQEYTVQTLHTVALFPQQLGDLNIDPVQISLGMVVRDDPFSIFQNTRQLPVITNDLWIRVRPLPAGAPESFQGALGKFEIKTSIDKRSITTDDALSLNVRIKGNGLSKFIEAPELKLDDQFEVYDPKVIQENTYPSNEDIISEKTFEYLLVPKNKGRKNIQVTFSYFDTDSSKYLTLKSPDYFIDVAQGKNELSNLSPEELLKKYQLRPLMVNNKLDLKGKYFYNSISFWLLIIFIFLSIPAMLLVKYRKIQFAKIDPDLIRQKRASRESLKRLKPARNLMDEGKHKAFFEAVSEAMNKYIRDKFTIANNDLTQEHIMNSMQEVKIPESMIEEFFAIRQKCDMALYAPTDQKASLEIYERSDKLIRELEITLNK